MKKVISIALAICCLANFSCSKKESNAVVMFTESAVSINLGTTYTPAAKVLENGVSKPYDLSENKLGLKYSSSDEKVFRVSESCVVEAVGTGDAMLNCTGGNTFAKMRITVKDGEFKIPDISKPFSADMKYGQYALKSSGNVNINPQSFDIDSKGFVWLEGASKPYVYLARFTGAGRVNTSTLALEGCSSDSPMQIYYAGHGTCLCVEPSEDSRDQYFWFANFATKQKDGSYLKPKVLSRTKYLPGKKILPQEAEEHFYFGEGYIQMLPSIDFANGIIAIWVSSKATVTMFSLEDVLSAPVKEISLGSMVWGGETDAPSQYAKEGNVTVTVKAHDCTGLTPVATIKASISQGTQGYCVYGKDRLSFHLAGASTPVNTMLSVFDTSGQFLMKEKGFGFDDDINVLIENGLTTKEYLEAEGIQIKNDVIYICVASTIGSNRVATILRFK